jgi:hypothetical protein
MLEAFPHLSHQYGSLFPDILQKVIVLDEQLCCQRGGTCFGLALERVTMIESALGWPILKDLGNFVPNKHPRDTHEATSKAFAYELDVRNHLLLLPGVEITGTAHPTHNLIKDE